MFVLLCFRKHNPNSAQILKTNREIEMDFMRPEKMLQEGKRYFGCRFPFSEFFHRSFELKSRAVYGKSRKTLRSGVNDYVNSSKDYISTGISQG